MANVGKHEKMMNLSVPSKKKLAIGAQVSIVDIALRERERMMMRNVKKKSITQNER